MRIIHMRRYTEIRQGLLPCSSEVNGDFYCVFQWMLLTQELTQWLILMASADSKKKKKGVYTQLLVGKQLRVKAGKHVIPILKRDPLRNRATEQLYCLLSQVLISDKVKNIMLTQECRLPLLWWLLGYSASWTHLPCNVSWRASICSISLRLQFFRW